MVIFLTHHAGWPTGAKLSMLVQKLIAQPAKEPEAEGAKNSDAERIAGD